MTAAPDGPSSLMASTRAKLYIDEALSNDDPSCVSVCELCVTTARSERTRTPNQIPQWLEVKGDKRGTSTMAYNHHNDGEYETTSNH